MGFAFVKGEFTEEHNARISLHERGLLYGDGLFETILVTGSVPVRADEHARRLHRSAVAMGMLYDRFQDDFVTYLGKVVRELIRQSGYTEARLKVILTRGESSISPRPPQVGGANLYATVQPLPATRPVSGGMTAILCSFPRNQHSPLVGHKSLNYLENVLALREADESEVDEAIFCNLDGRLCEGATTNLFIVRDEEVLTPPVKEGLLPGITRAHVLDLAQALEVPTQERSLKLEDLWSAREAFLTNSLIGIAPLLELDGRLAGPAGAGPMTERLQTAYRKVLDHLIMNYE